MRKFINVAMLGCPLRLGPKNECIARRRSAARKGSHTQRTGHLRRTGDYVCRLRYLLYEARDAFIPLAIEVEVSR